MKYKINIEYQNNNSLNVIVNDINLQNNKLSVYRNSDFIYRSGGITIPIKNIKYIKITPMEENEK